MHEDAEIECHAFRGKCRIFCIASAGDTAMRLSLEHQVVACDINPVQLAYAERRAAGAPIETGDAERVMQILRAFMPVIGWRIEAVRAFLALTNPAEQIAYWHAHLNTRRFRTAFDTLMSRPVLRTIYARQFLSFLPQTSESSCAGVSRGALPCMPMPPIHISTPCFSAKLLSRLS